MFFPLLLYIVMFSCTYVASNISIHATLFMATAWSNWLYNWVGVLKSGICHTSISFHKQELPALYVSHTPIFRLELKNKECELYAWKYTIIFHFHVSLPDGLFPLFFKQLLCTCSFCLPCLLLSGCSTSFCRILTMVCWYWTNCTFGLYPSSGVSKKIEE
jgi:hypothetical protein